MKIAILNGNPDRENARFDRYISDLSGSLEKAGHRTENIFLRQMNVKYCTGCWGCWVKTPGRCIYDDDSSMICRVVIKSDLVIFSSPISMGFISSLLKKVNEKLIPLLHPYLEIVQQECHHLSRYDRYPLFGLLLETGRSCDAEDIEIISAIYARDALNFKSRLAFTMLTDSSLDEVVNEINII